MFVTFGDVRAPEISIRPTGENMRCGGVHTNIFKGPMFVLDCGRDDEGNWKRKRKEKGRRRLNRWRWRSRLPFLGTVAVLEQCQNGLLRGQLTTEEQGVTLPPGLTLNRSGGDSVALSRRERGRGRETERTNERTKELNVLFNQAIAPIEGGRTH